MGCLLIHSMWLEMLRYLMIVNSLLNFLMHVKCVHVVYPLPLVRPVKSTASNFFSAVVGLRCAFLAVGVHRLVGWGGHKQCVHLFSYD